MSTENDFKLHLPGLLQVLAEHLYADRRVGVRELLQNAHDSCSRRQIESEGQAYEPRIDVRIDASLHLLEIEDNGSGLTEDEIVEYLTTIGSGYTRHLRESDAFGESRELDQLIGQFGLGFLSAFLVAESVELETLSGKPDGKPVRWRSRGDGSYEMEPGSRDTVGTRIRLFCKPAMRHLLNERVLGDLITEYCDLLPHPIYLDGQLVPANRGQAPWEADEFDRAMNDFLESRSIQKPLCVLPLRDWTIQLNLDSIKVPLSGAFYVPQRSIASLQEFGDASIYIRNMFICSNHRTLLPNWAKFVRAFISSPMLQPTASRESIHEDEGFELVSQAVEEQLLKTLEELSASKPELWNEIVRSHTDLIVGWVSSDDSLFERLVDSIELETSQGRKTIDQCLSGSSEIYFRSQSIVSPAERLLANAHPAPVIDASWFGVQPFLHRYAQHNPQAKLVSCDSVMDSLVKRSPSTRYQALLDRFGQLELQERFVTASFEPSQLCAVVSYPPEAEVLRNAKRAIEDDALMPGIADILPDWVSQKESTIPDLDGIFYLNTASPLIQQFNELAESGKLEDAPMNLLVHMTRLLCQAKLDTKEGVDSLKTLNQALTQLIQP